MHNEKDKEHSQILDSFKNAKNSKEIDSLIRKLKKSALEKRKEINKIKREISNESKMNDAIYAVGDNIEVIRAYLTKKYGLKRCNKIIEMHLEGFKK